MIITGKRGWNFVQPSNFTKISKGGLELKKEIAERFYSDLPP
jgi:hypothetical protein